LAIAAAALVPVTGHADPSAARIEIDGCQFFETQADRRPFTERSCARTVEATANIGPCLNEHLRFWVPDATTTKAGRRQQN